MPSFWIPALKEYNGATKQWCIPRKGTPEYDEVKKIMDRLKAEAQRLPEKRKLRKPAEVEAEMEKPVVKRKLRMPKAEEAKMEKPEEPEMEPKIENIADIENFNNLWEYKSGSSERAYYELVQVKPPVFKTRFIKYIVEKGEEKNGRIPVTTSYKVAEKGNILRKVVKNGNVYDAYATSGAKEGEVVAELRSIIHFNRDVFDWLTGKTKEAPVYKENIIRKNIGKRQKKYKTKEHKILDIASEELLGIRNTLSEFIRQWEGSGVFDERVKEYEDRLAEIESLRDELPNGVKEADKAYEAFKKVDLAKLFAKQYEVMYKKNKEDKFLKQTRDMYRNKIVEEQKAYDDSFKSLNEFMETIKKELRTVLTEGEMNELEK